VEPQDPVTIETSETNVQGDTSGLSADSQSQVEPEPEMNAVQTENPSSSDSVSKDSEILDETTTAQNAPEGKIESGTTTDHDLFEMISGKVPDAASEHSAAPVSFTGSSTASNTSRSTSHQPAERKLTSRRKARHKENIDGVLHTIDDVLGKLRDRIGPSQRQRPPMIAPDTAKKFVECGDMADRRTLGLLTRDLAPWPGSPHHQHGIPLDSTCEPDENVSHDERENSQFGYGKTSPINQPSVREEIFDPFAQTPPKTLKELKAKNRPFLEVCDNRTLKTLFNKSPDCFCGKPCARFDGVVPVYVCGVFKRGYIFILKH
jgi:hypothetical protein